MQYWNSQLPSNEQLGLGCTILGLIISINLGIINIAAPVCPHQYRQISLCIHEHSGHVELKSDVLKLKTWSRSSLNCSGFVMIIDGYAGILLVEAVGRGPWWTAPERVRRRFFWNLSCSTTYSPTQYRINWPILQRKLHLHDPHAAVRHGNRQSFLISLFCITLAILGGFLQYLTYTYNPVGCVPLAILDWHHPLPRSLRRLWAEEVPEFQ